MTRRAERMPTHGTVDEITVGVYVVPTDAQEPDGTIAWDSTTMIVVRVRSGDHVGTGWTYGAPQCGDIVTSLLAPIILGKTVVDIGARWEEMVRAARNDGRQGAVGYAISAVDVALWDAKARMVGLPLHHLLGVVRPSVPIYGSGGFTTYTSRQLRDQLGGWREQGIPRVKITIGESWGTDTARDADRIRQARTIIGDECELFVDANDGCCRRRIRLRSSLLSAPVPSTRQVGC